MSPLRSQRSGVTVSAVGRDGLGGLAHGHVVAVVVDDPHLDHGQRTAHRVGITAASPSSIGVSGIVSDSGTSSSNRFTRGSP